MELIRLGKSNVEITPIAFGAWAIGGWMWGGADENDAIKAVRRAYDLGITTIDTAPAYGFGKSEELVSKALEGVSRDKFQLLTKFGLNWSSNQGEYFFDSVDNSGEPFKMYKWASRERVIEECENSLRRLKTDYIDLLQIHWPDATTPIHETFEAVGRLIEQGKVRAAGVCNYNTDQINEALETISLVSNQVPYSLVYRDIETKEIPQAIEKGLGIIAYSPLQRGLLTGKIKPGHNFGEGDTRHGNRFYTEESISTINTLLEEIKPIAEKYGASLSQVILNWTYHRPGITCLLAGARSPQQIEETSKSLDFKLSQTELDSITAISDRYISAVLRKV